MISEELSQGLAQFASNLPMIAAANGGRNCELVPTIASDNEPTAQAVAHFSPPCSSQSHMTSAAFSRKRLQAPASVTPENVLSCRNHAAGADEKRWFP